MITLHRTEGVELTAEYNDATLLPNGIESHIAKFVIPSLPALQNKEETPKIRIKVKLDINGVVQVENAELSETVEEVAAPAPTETKTEETPAEPMQTEENKTPENAEKTEEKKAEEKKPEEKKVKVIKTPLTVKDFTPSLPQKDLQNLIDEEARMVAADKLAFETAEKKNAVESYIYEMRDKLSGVLSEFATEQEKESLSKIFTATEDWLYGDGENATKSVYSKKLDEMKSIGDPVTKRRYEAENRLDAFSSLRKQLEQFRLSATTEDPKYDHIAPEEKQKVVTECNNVEKWLNEKMVSQDKVAKSADPIVTIQEVTKKQDELTKFSNSILNKPKPKPEPKKEEPKKEEKPAEEEKKPEESTEQKPAEKTEMDLD